MNYIIKTKGLLISMLIIVFTSCNLFLSPPSLRQNPNDDRIQISGFTAAPTGDTSITTLWNWLLTSSWMDYDERIEEIKIIHSTLGYTEFNIPFAGETFTDQAKWQFEWKNLKADSPHYFSMFVKTQEGRWTPSYKVKVVFPGSAETGVNYSREQALTIDDAGVIDLNPPGQLSVSNWQWAVVSFDFPGDVYIVNAIITISVSALTEITFAPLDGIPSENDMDKWNQLSTNSIVRENAAMTFTTGGSTYDITEVVRAAVLGPMKSILIKTTDGSNFTIDNNASAPFITADILK